MEAPDQPDATAVYRGTSCAENALRAVFGHTSFRPGQREVIDAVVSGRDALAIMPTGAGKSVTFQLPARLGRGPVLVVSPLIALMRDQVERASARGLRASWVESGLGEKERRSRLSAMADGSIDLLYVSPESLPGVAEAVGHAVRLLAVDEAHCISQWGHDFRPAYRRIAEVRGRFGSAPTLAVTATATRAVADDVVASLGLADPLVWRGTFDRPNLRLAAHLKDRLTDARAAILETVRAHEGAAGIVYCLSRRQAGAIATYLRSRGVSAAPYHAGMDASTRSEVQAAFASGGVDVVVATIAFGMGIDKADVRFVMHADLPASIEAYAQEVGRAGRDGLASDCLLLYSRGDVRRRAVLTRSLPLERRKDARRRVAAMYRFAAGGGCRHVRLCGYFEERVDACSAACDACGGPSASDMGGGGRATFRC
jgi:ATP-dependent DNA helicase RecQ